MVAQYSCDEIIFLEIQFYNSNILQRNIFKFRSLRNKKLLKKKHRDSGMNFACKYFEKSNFIQHLFSI